KKVVAKPEKVVEVKKPEEPVVKPSLAPRKGRKHFDKEAAGLVEEAGLTLPPKTPDLTPSEIAREFLDVAPKQEPTAIELEPWYLPETPKPAPEAPKAAAPAAPAETPRAEARPMDVSPHPGTVSKKIVVPKAKSKILMRTSTEKVVTPTITDKIL